MTVSPADFLVGTMKKEHDQPLVQLFIFTIGYPFVFIFRMVGALISTGFFAVHFLINCFGYVYSLGGINFHAFLFDEMTEKKSRETQPYGTTANIVALITAIVLLLTLVLCLMIPVISNAINADNDFSEHTSANSAVVMSANQSKSFNVRNGEDFWVEFLAHTDATVSALVQSNDTLSISLTLYENPYSSSLKFTSGFSAATIVSPASTAKFYYLRISCEFYGSSGTVSVSLD